MRAGRDLQHQPHGRGHAQRQDVQAALTSACPRPTICATCAIPDVLHAAGYYAPLGGRNAIPRVRPRVAALGWADRSRMLP